MTDLNKLRSEFEELPEVKQWIERLIYGDNSEVYIPIDETEENNAIATWINGAWFVWKLKAKAQAVPEGYVLLPVTPNYEMWSGIARHLGRYMQMHDRYCPKTLKKYFDRFIGDIPEWLNKEVKDWDSDHAFATADLPVFIYMSMLEASESGA